jgi:hypothetical protein
MIYSAGLCYYYMVYTGLIIPWLKDSVISWNYYGIAISDKDGQVVMNITTSLIIRGDNNYRSILLNLLLIFNLQSAWLLTYLESLRELKKASGIGTDTGNAMLALSEFCTNKKLYVALSEFCTDKKPYVVHDLLLCTLKFTNAYYDMCSETSGSSCNLYHSLKALTECVQQNTLGIAAHMNSSILQCVRVSHGILVKLCASYKGLSDSKEHPQIFFTPT